MSLKEICMGTENKGLWKAMKTVANNVEIESSEMLTESVEDEDYRMLRCLY